MKKQLDLYKAIIGASVLLLPAAAGWAYWLQGRIDAGRAAVADAQGQRGDLSAIGLLQHEIDLMRAKAGNMQAEADPRLYFDVQISKSSQGGLKSTDYVINNLQAVRIPDLKAIDQQWSIEFKEEGKTPLALSRDLIQAILHNIEAQSPAWRLRSLHLRNKSTRDLRSRGAKPPPEIDDEWYVDRMVFAKREPDQAQQPGPRKPR